MSARPITLTRHIMTKKATTIPVADLGLIMERLELIGKRIARDRSALMSTAGEMLRQMPRAMAALHSFRGFAHTGFVLAGGYLVRVASPSR